MENRSKEIAKILDKYATKISTNWPFYVKGNIPSKCVDNAMKTYAKGIDRTTLVGLYDTTLLNNGKVGYLFTDKGIYYKDILSPCDRLLYANIVSVRLGPKVSKEENRSIFFKLIDGTEEVWTTTYIRKAPLKEFMDELLLFLKGDGKETNQIEDVESKNEDGDFDLMLFEEEDEKETSQIEDGDFDLMLFEEEDEKETSQIEDVERKNEDSELIKKLNYLSDRFD